MQCVTMAAVGTNVNVTLTGVVALAECARKETFKVIFKRRAQRAQVDRLTTTE